MYFACENLPTASRIHFDFQCNHQHYEDVNDNMPGILLLSSSLDEQKEFVHGENEILIDFALRKSELDEIDTNQIAGWFNIGWFKISITQVFEKYFIDVVKHKNRKVYIPLETATELGCVSDIHLEIVFEIHDVFVAAHFKSIQMYPHRLYQLSNMFKLQLIESIFASD